MHFLKAGSCVRTWMLLIVAISVTACGGSSLISDEQGDEAAIASDPEQGDQQPEFATLHGEIIAAEYNFTGTGFTGANDTPAAHITTPLLTVSPSVGRLDFRWDNVDNASTARLIQTNLLTREFLPLFETQDGLITEWSYDINTPLFDWTQTRFMLEVCNDDTCVYSASVASTDYQAAVAGKLPANDVTAETRFGAALALTPDGSVLVVGEPSSTSEQGHTDSGALAVYFRVAEQWWQDTHLKLSNISSGAQLGQSVSISDDGDTIVAGAPGYTHGNTVSGAAIVFARFGEGWSQTDILLPGEIKSAAFGQQVKISGDGNTIIVSSPQTAVDGQPLAGSVSVFQLISGRWQPTQTITATAPAAEAQFGHAVAFSSDASTLIIGDMHSNGRIFTYRWHNNHYAQPTTNELKAPESAARFGSNISTNANGTLLLTEMRGAHAPRLLIYSHSVDTAETDESEWELKQTLALTGDIPETEQITLSHSADASVIAAGVVSPLSAASVVHTFVSSTNRNGLHYWRYRTTLLNPEQNANGFGTALSMSADGGTLVVGAPDNTGGTSPGIGGVFYY